MEKILLNPSTATCQINLLQQPSFDVHSHPSFSLSLLMPFSVPFLLFSAFEILFLFLYTFHKSFSCPCPFQIPTVYLL